MAAEQEGLPHLGADVWAALMGRSGCPIAFRVPEGALDVVGRPGRRGSCVVLSEQHGAAQPARRGSDGVRRRLVLPSASSPNLFSVGPSGA